MKTDIQEIMAQMPHTTTIEGTVCIRWSRPGIGFGETVFFHDEEGNLQCDNEGMSKEFVKGVLCDLVDEVMKDERRMD